MDGVEEVCALDVEARTNTRSPVYAVAAPSNAVRACENCVPIGNDSSALAPPLRPRRAWACCELEVVGKLIRSAWEQSSKRKWVGGVVNARIEWGWGRKCGLAWERGEGGVTRHSGGDKPQL